LARLDAARGDHYRPKPAPGIAQRCVIMTAAEIAAALDGLAPGMVALQVSLIVRISVILADHDRMSNMPSSPTGTQKNRFEELVVGTLREAHPDVV